LMALALLIIFSQIGKSESSVFFRKISAACLINKYCECILDKISGVSE
jgi:hypothetical protein